MDLQHIDIRPQSLHARLHGIEDMFPRQADLIHHRPIIGADSRDAGLRARGVDAEVAFGEEDELGARDRVAGDGFGDDFFGAAVGVDVCLRGV